MADLKALAKKEQKKMVFLALYAVLSGVAIVSQAYLLVAIIDRIFIQGTAFSEIVNLLIGLFAAIFARTIFQYQSGKTGLKMAAKVKRELRDAIVRQYSLNPVQRTIQGQTGQKISALVDVVDEVDSYFSRYIPQVFQSLIIPIIILLVIFSEHVATGIIIIITAPFIPIFMIVIGFKTKDKTEEQLEEMSRFSGAFLDTLQGLTTLKLYGQSARQKEAIRTSSIGFRNATMEVLKIAFQNSLVLEFVSMLSIGLVALEVALRMIVFQDLSFYTGFLMLMLAPEFYTKLKDLGSAFHSAKESMAAAKKLEGEFANSVQPVTWGQEKFISEKPPAIELKNVHFRYPENEEFALSNINMKIRPLEKVAIVGATGSGKTTLLHLIAGLVPPLKGEVAVNGKLRSKYSESSWFNQLSYISQEPYLFAGTIYDNITLGSNQTVTKEEVIEAAEKAGISALAGSLPNGYDTFIGEGGRGLSGGEKQRIAIARAFLKQPSIILFDEPTTGLDLQTERFLQSSIEELAARSTLITVAHRLHTIQQADQIIFLDNGKIIASGTHEELMDINTSYRRMVTVQQGGAI